MVSTDLLLHHLEAAIHRVESPGNGHEPLVDRLEASTQKLEKLLMLARRHWTVSIAPRGSAQVSPRGHTDGVSSPVLERALGKPTDLSKIGPLETWTYRASNGTVVFVVVGDTVTLQATGTAPAKETK